MSETIQNLRVATKYAVCSATLALALFAPGMTFAAADPKAAGGTRIEDVFVRGELVKDSSSKTGWVVAVTAENTDGHATRCALNATLTETVLRPMARVSPMPTPLFNERIVMEVEGHGTSTVRIDVPEKIAAGLDAKATDPTPKVATQAVAFPTPMVRYGLRFDRVKDPNKVASGERAVQRVASRM
jgi:hypothetical protein